MKTTRSIAALVATIASILLLSAMVVPSLAVSPIDVEALTQRSTLPDRVAGQFRIREAGGPTRTVNMDTISKVLTARIVVQPGAAFPWHTHVGPVLVTVAQGALVSIDEDCSEVTYVAGEAYMDPGHGHVHTAANRTAGETILYATFFQVPPTGPVTLTEGVTGPVC